jgi:CRP/FNR family transcriptional regulator, cyclic AMP receptor protein
MKSLKERIVDHPFFIGMAPEHLDIVARHAREAEYTPDQILFSEGEPANRFFVIEQGKIALEAHETANRSYRIQLLGEGDVLGWSWLFPPFVWHFRARAIEPVRVIVLDGAHLLVTAEQDKTFGYELMKRLAQLVIKRLQITRKELVAREFESALDG